MFESTSGVGAYGGGGAGLTAGTDFAIEGTNCVMKQIKAAEKGFLYDAVTNFTIGADDHFYIWVRGATPGVCDTRDNRGIVVCIGDDTSNFVKFHVNGKDTLPRGGTLPYAIRYVNTTLTNYRTLVGSPSTTPSQIGGGLKGLASVKTDNIGVDAARIGTGYDITGGTGVDDPGEFQGIADDDDSTSEGVFRKPIQSGIFILQGKLRFGGTSNECEFTDTGAFVAAADTFHSLSDFNEILVEHADTIIDLTVCTFRGLGTNSPGRFEMITSAATVDMVGCSFIDWGDIILGTGASLLSCSFVNTDTITANGADLTGSKVEGYEVAADTSPLIWDVATDPDGLLDDMSFTKGTLATHAIEFGTSSPTAITLNGIDFSGYHANNGNNDSTFHIKRTSGTVTITIVGGSGNLSYKTAGATVVIIDNPATLELHVTDIGTGANISGARAYVTADSVGPLPYQDSVTISRTGATASVAHTAHGLSNSDKVFIEGANQDEYNGVQTISNVSTNAYDYTVSGSPTTPATGTIKSTAVIIDGTTNASGLISDSRSYSSDQEIAGRVRHSSSSPFYKTSPIVGTIDSGTGLEIAVQMVRDE